MRIILICIALIVCGSTAFTSCDPIDDVLSVRNVTILAIYPRANELFVHVDLDTSGFSSRRFLYLFTESNEIYRSEFSGGLAFKKRDSVCVFAYNKPELSRIERESSLKFQYLLLRGTSEIERTKKYVNFAKYDRHDIKIFYNDTSEGIFDTIVPISNISFFSGGIHLFKEVRNGKEFFEYITVENPQELARSIYQEVIDMRNTKSIGK